MTTLKAHFDGKVLIPDEPVDLPMNCSLHVQVTPVAEQKGDDNGLKGLAELARQYPAGTDAPSDLAEQHDHYLYGRPKRS